MLPIAAAPLHQPVLALVEDLRLRVNPLDLGDRNAGEQVVADAADDFGTHLHGAGDEGIERVLYAAAERVLDGDDGEIGMSALDLGERGGDVADRLVLGCQAELADGGEMGEAAARAEEGDPQRPLEGEGSAHDFAVDRQEHGIRKRPGVVLAKSLQDLAFAIGGVDRRAVGRLELADLLGELPALADQLDELLVNRIDSAAHLSQISGLVRRWVGFVFQASPVSRAMRWISRLVSTARRMIPADEDCGRSPAHLGMARPERES